MTVHCGLRIADCGLRIGQNGDERIDMNAEDFKTRTKAFALRVIKLTQALPRTGVGSVIGRQLVRSGTSVGANYRAACRAKSRANFIAKMGIVEEECDESMYWMELLVDSGLVRGTLLEDLSKEANEIVALVVSSIRTARSRRQPAIRNPQSARKGRNGT